MKPLSYLLSLIFYLSSSCAALAQSDPVVMRINGKDVTRSEFEYNFNKNNTDGVIDRKDIDEYTELFINYKLKVEAALDAKYDTMTSYQQEFRSYRDQQIRPLLVTPEAEEKEVRNYYDQILAKLDGKKLIQPAHIYVQMMQQATPAQMQAAKARIDSIYAVLQGGADFAQTAATASDDPGTKQRGGIIGWVGPGNLPKEIEDACYALKVGETSKPMKSTIGWHIFKLMEEKDLEPYDTLSPNIRSFLEARGMKDRIAGQMVDSLVKASAGKTVEQVMDEQSERFAAQDDELKYLIQEYHDGLLLYEIMQRTVWEPAAKDTVALVNYFKANKKKYSYEKPHFAGALLQARSADILKQVKKALKGKAEDNWASIVKTQFNKDSVLVRFERRNFEQGENALVDSLTFGVKQGKTRLNKTFPVVGVIGRKLKKGPQVWTDVSAQVVQDYQGMKEQEFVEELRRRYKFEVYKDALETVNNH